MVEQQLPQSPALRLSVAPEMHSIQPGEQAVFLITVENSSDEAQVQSVTIEGIPGDWYRVDFDSRRRAFPGEQRSATLFVNVPSDAASDTHKVQITGTAGDASTGLLCTLQVLGAAPPPPPPPPPAPEPEVAPPPPPPPAIETPPAPPPSEPVVAASAPQPLEAPAPPPPPPPPPVIESPVAEEPVAVEPEPEPAPPPPPPEPEPAPPPPPPPPPLDPPPAPVVSVRPGLVIMTSDGPSVERLTLTIRNPGDKAADYAISLAGLDRSWFTINARVRVPSRQSIETELQLHPPSGAKQADYPWDVRVRVDGFDVTAETSGWLSIQAPAPKAPPAPSAAPSPVIPAPIPTPTPPPPPVYRQPVAASPPPPPSMAPSPPPPPPPPPESLYTPPDVTLAPRANFQFGPNDVSAQAIVTIRNRGKLMERYDITMEGIPEEWFALSLTELRLDPGANSQIPLRLSPNTGSGWPAGDYEFRLRVIPQTSPENAVQVGGLLSITGVSTFEARLTPPQAEGASRVYDLTVINTGDLPLTPVMTASDPEGKVRVKIPKTRTLDPAQEALFHLKVGAKRSRILGAAETFDFRVKVAPTENAPASATRVLDARFIHQARFGFRGAFMLAFLAAIVGIIVLVVAIAEPIVVDASNWVGCQFDSSYRFSHETREVKKESCGGSDREEELQKWRTQPATLVSPLTPLTQMNEPVFAGDRGAL